MCEKCKALDERIEWARSTSTCSSASLKSEGLELLRLLYEEQKREFHPAGKPRISSAAKTSN
jgi:hypothetical protein